MTNGSFMKVKSIAELEHSAMLLTCIKRQSVLKNIFGLFFSSGRLRQVLLYWCFRIAESAILLNCIKRQSVLKTIFCLLFEKPLKTGFTVWVLQKKRCHVIILLMHAMTTFYK